MLAREFFIKSVEAVQWIHWFSTLNWSTMWHVESPLTKLSQAITPDKDYFICVAVYAGEIQTDR
jgi:hypothetical protein